MPWSNPKQPVAIFLDLKRRKGEGAARAFAKKHPGEMARGAQASHNKRNYRPRSKRNAT